MIKVVHWSSVISR